MLIINKFLKITFAPSIIPSIPIVKSLKTKLACMDLESPALCCLSWAVKTIFGGRLQKDASPKMCNDITGVNNQCHHLLEPPPGATI